MEFRKMAPTAAMAMTAIQAVMKLLILSPSRATDLDHSSFFEAAKSPTGPAFFRSARVDNPRSFVTSAAPVRHRDRSFPR